MKTLLTLLAAAGLFAGAALAAEKWTKPQQEVAGVFKAWADAELAGDVDREMGLFAPAFTMWDFATAAPMDFAAVRQQTIETFKTAKVTACVIEPDSIRIDGAGAVAHGRYTETMKDNAGVSTGVGGPWSASLVRSNNKWRVLSLSYVNQPPAGSPVIAAPLASPAPAAAPEMKRLDVWYGDWTYAGEYHATPLGEAAKFTGTMTGRPTLNGNVAEFINIEQGPAGETRALELCWFDPAAKKFAYVYLGNDGYIEQGPFTMTEDLCTWEGTGAAGGTAFRIRGTEIVSPDQRMLTRKTELSVDGKIWLPFFDSKFTKVAAPTVEQELVKLENDWCQAYLAKDVKALGRIEADNWICTTWEGEVLGRTEDMADVETGTYAATEFKVENLKVQVHGDTAVVSGRQTEKATYKGKDASGVFRITDTWLRRDGRWQCIASHLSKIVTP